MVILSDSSQQQLREVFESGLTDDVKVILYTKPETAIFIPGRECQTCKETGELLQEVTGCSDKLQLEVHDFYEEQEQGARLGIRRIPAFLLEGNVRGRVRFFGIPAGLEFPAFIDDILDVSRGSTSLSDASRESLSLLTKDIHIQVFTTPT